MEFNLFGFNINTSRNKEVKRSTETITGTYNTGGVGLFYDKLMNYGSPLFLSTVYRCVSVISDSVASLPLYLYDTKKNNEYVTSDLSYLLNIAPSAIQTRFTFFQSIVRNILLQGNAYCKIIRSAGEITEIRLLKNSDVDVIVNTLTDGSTVVKYSVLGKPVLTNDILHFTNITGADCVTGLSVMQYASNSIKLAQTQESQALSFFSSGGNVNGLLLSKKMLDDTQKQEIKESWNTSIGDGNGVAVLGGDLDFRSLSVNNKESQLLESRSFSVVDICRFFGVSPLKVYTIEGATYSNFEQANVQFLTDTLNPLLEKIELELRKKLFTKKDSLRFVIKFDTSNLLRTDFKNSVEAYTKLFQSGVLTINEIREELGYNLVDEDSCNTNFVQVNMMQVNKNIDEVNK